MDSANFLITKIYRYLFQGGSISKFNKLRGLIKFTDREKTAYQASKLVEVLVSAKGNVPYYINILKDVDVQHFNYEEFCKIPLLTKSIIRNEGKNLCNAHYGDLKSIVKNSSGGSTGEPVTFYQTLDQKLSGGANYYLANYINGVSPYAKTVVFWGAVRDMHSSGQKSLKDSFREVVNNSVTLNTFVMSEEIIRQYIDVLVRQKPVFIKAYVHSIYEIAKFINRNNIKIDFTPVIHTTTGPLYEEIRVELKKAFNNCHIFNFYGSREVSAIAAEDTSEDGLYVLFDNVFVEILDVNGVPVKKGEEGEIVVTTLNNSYMPLIRYKIGDRAIKGDKFPGTLRLESVLGRTLGVIYRPDGSYIDGQFFTSLFFNNSGIEQFQLVQKDINKIHLRIVKGSDFDDEKLNAIISIVKGELSTTEIITIFVPNIDLTKTGKIMYVYSELDINN